MYNFPKSGFGRFEMRTWIFLISTFIHGFSQNSPVQAVVVVLVRVHHGFTYHFRILLGGNILETMYYPKGKFASAANTMALNNAINMASQILKKLGLLR